MQSRIWLRQHIKGLLLGQRHLALRSGGVADLASRFADIASLGLYLHIPFCRQICPYCPYKQGALSGERGRALHQRGAARDRPLCRDRR